MRHPLLSGEYPANFSSDYTWHFDLVVLLAFTAVTLTLAALLFGEEDHLGRILLTEGRRPKTRM